MDALHKDQEKKKTKELPGWLVYAIILVPTYVLSRTNNFGWAVVWLGFLGLVGVVQHLQHNTLTFLSIPNKPSAQTSQKKIVLPWWVGFFVTFVPTTLLGLFGQIGLAMAWLGLLGVIGFVQHLRDNTIIFMSVPNEPDPINDGEPKPNGLTR